MATLARYTLIDLKDTDQLSSAAIPGLPAVSTISDIRRLKDFKTLTISGFQRTKVASALDKALKTQKLEESLWWSFQLLASGLGPAVYDKLVAHIYKHINIYNPQVPVLLAAKSRTWAHITGNPRYKKDGILQLRNHASIRHIIVELVVIGCTSRVRQLDQMPKITSADFDVQYFNSRLEASSMPSGIYQGEDPKEMRLASAEFAHHLARANIVKCLYWLNWMITWDSINVKKYGKYECSTRSGPYFGAFDVKIPAKQARDFVWILWAIIDSVVTQSLEYSRQRAIFAALWEQFRARRYYLVIVACSYICNNITWATPVVPVPAVLYRWILKCDYIFALITEKLPATGASYMDKVVIDNDKYRGMSMAKRQEKLDATDLTLEKGGKLRIKKNNISPESVLKINIVNKVDSNLQATAGLPVPQSGVRLYPSFIGSSAGSGYRFFTDGTQENADTTATPVFS
jgi:hypothetical protein